VYSSHFLVHKLEIRDSSIKAETEEGRKMDTPIFETWLRPWLRMALLGRPAPDDSRSHHVLLMYYFFSVIATSQAV